MLIGITSINLPDLPDSNNTISFSGVSSFTSVLVALFGFCSAFLLLVRSVTYKRTAVLPEDRSVRNNSVRLRSEVVASVSAVVAVIVCRRQVRAASCI